MLFARENPQLRASNNDTAASLDSVSSNGKSSTSIARKQMAVYSKTTVLQRKFSSRDNTKVFMSRSGITS